MQRILTNSVFLLDLMVRQSGWHRDRGVCVCVISSIIIISSIISSSISSSSSSSGSSSCGSSSRSGSRLPRA